jgi:hypothetical protein
MLWLFRKILDRLLVRSVLHVATELESQLQLERIDRQADFLRKAHQLEQENIAGLDAVAADLRASAAKMAGDEAPGENVVAVVALLRQEDLRTDGEATAAEKGPALNVSRGLLPTQPTAVTKRRGRPRKEAVIDATPTTIEPPVNG